MRSGRKIKMKKRMANRSKEEENNRVILMASIGKYEYAREIEQRTCIRGTAARGVNVYG